MAFFLQGSPRRNVRRAFLHSLVSGASAFLLIYDLGTALSSLVALLATSPVIRDRDEEDAPSPKQ